MKINLEKFRTWLSRNGLSDEMERTELLERLSEYEAFVTENRRRLRAEMAEIIDAWESEND